MQYDVLSKLKLKLDAAGHRGYERYFFNEFGRIVSAREPSGNAPTITVKIVRTIPEPQHTDIARRIRVKKLFTFEYLVRDIHSRDVVIFFKRHPLDTIYMNAIAVYLQAQILEPVMYMKLLEQDVLFMHAAGISDGASGYLFAASGGTGKTTFSIAMLDYGYKLLGDDLLIVDVSKRVVYPYPRPLHLFAYNVSTLGSAKVPTKFKIAIYLKNLIRFALQAILQTEFLISTRVHAEEIMREDPFGAAVPYTQLWLLTKEGAPCSVKTVTSQTLDSLTEQIMQSADLNGSLYDLLGDDVAAVVDVKRKEAALIGRLLTQMNSIGYLNPRLLGENDLRTLANGRFAVQLPT